MRIFLRRDAILNSASFVRGFAFAFFFLASIPAISAENPPSHYITYEQYEATVIDLVSRIPDLDLYWKWAKKHRCEAFFGGGALRGLLHDLTVRLRTETLDEIRAAPVAKAGMFLMQENSDRDVYDADCSGKSVFTPLDGWDHLSEAFHRESVQAGGSALEKLRVSPFRIDDPYGALRDYYEGRIRYVDVPEEQFAPFRSSEHPLNLNTKAALVMRYIRQCEELLDEPVSEDVWRHLRQVVESEVPFIPVRNHWVQKSLNKYFAAIAKKRSDYPNIDRTFQSLHENLEHAGLLGPLLMLGYGVVYDPETKATRLLFQTLSQEERKLEWLLAVKHSNHTPELLIWMLNSNLDLIRTKSDFVAYFDPFQMNPGEDVLKVYTKHVVRARELLVRLGGGASEVLKMRRWIRDPKALRRLMDAVLPHIKTAGEYREMVSLAPGVGDENRPAVIAGMEAFVGKTLPTFFKLKPTRGEVLALQSEMRSAELRNQIARAAAVYFNQPMDLLLTNLPGSGLPTASELKLLQESADASFSRLLGLSPTIREVRLALSRSSDEFRSRDEIRKLEQVLNRPAVLAKGADEPFSVETERVWLGQLNRKLRTIVLKRMIANERSVDRLMQWVPLYSELWPEGTAPVGEVSLLRWVLDRLEQLPDAKASHKLTVLLKIDALGLRGDCDNLLMRFKN